MQGAKMKKSSGQRWCGVWSIAPPLQLINRAQIGKKGLKMLLRGSILQNFLTQGKGTSLSLDHIHAQSRPFGPRCVGHNNIQTLAPFEIL